jgi:hypothetical protein
MMRFFFSVLLMVLLILLLGVLVIGLLILWSTGLSWLLIKLLPFTLFEGTLLVLLATLFVLYIGGRLLLAGPPLPSTGSEMLDTMPFSLEDEIPENRFWKSGEAKTNETWFRYAIANEIYQDFDSIELDATLGKAQQKELAIRLTDIIVEMLKERRFRKGTRRVSITVPQILAQMEKMGQRPYDQDILEAVVSSVNIHLSYDEYLQDIVLEKTWDELDED